MLAEFIPAEDLLFDEQTELITEEPTTPLLDKYTTNLSAKVAANPASYEAFGRDSEIEAVTIALLRKNKNSPLLVGEAGTGKTAIVEGLALRIFQGQVPPKLQALTVRTLELSTLMNENEDGIFITKFRGLIDELVATKGENLLFIDEIHTLVGTGSADGNALDAGNVLKPALARGEIQMIGATTIDEYHESIETDKALERRFQQIEVKEPTADQAQVILQGVAPNYARYHQVTISKQALTEAVNLSIRYLPDRYLPDKALDLLDEACTIVSAQNKAVVTEESIAEVLKRRTGIPVTTILKDEASRLTNIESKLSRRVKGQAPAIQAVANAVTISKAGLQDEDKPLATFLFLGTTGVGKTELAKALAEVVFDSEHAMIRLDMSEYSQPGSSLKLIGTRKEKGVLTEAVKHNPYSIVLFDELEKGDREVHDLLLQILDDGRLTDGTGRLINFKNTIIIMTTNIGAEKIRMNAELKGEVDQLTEREYQQFIEAMEIELQSEFRPEFINRIEYKIVFKMLSEPVIREIAIKDLEILNNRMKKQGAYLVYDEDLLDYLTFNGTDVNNGARPLMRLINRKVLAPIATELLKLPKLNSNQQLYRVKVVVDGRKPNGVDELLDHRKISIQIQSVPNNSVPNK